MKAFLCQNHIENGNGHAIPKEIMPIQNMLAEGTFRRAFFFFFINYQEVQTCKVFKQSDRSSINQYILTSSK